MTARPLGPGRPFNYGFPVLPRGWQCPRCGAVMAPTQAACLWCASAITRENTAANDTKPFEVPPPTREQAAFLAWPFTPAP